MMMVNKIITLGFLAQVMASMVFMAGGLKTTLAQPNPAIPGLNQGSSSNATSGTTPNMKMNMSTSGTTNKTTVTRDSTTVLLEGKTIPAKGFIHLYDSTPYMMNAGHISSTHSM